MLRARLILILLLVICFSLAACLQPRQASRDVSQGESGSVLALLAGDGRQMIAARFFAKADAYFHRGKYPSIFEQNAQPEENHMAGEASHEEHEDHDEHDAGPAARDWIEAFGRHFVPNEHVHLEGGNEREMLPWLRLSASLDPHQIEIYVVTAYWLRERLGKVDEAEQFLREGLKENPNSPDLLYELGRIYYENRKDLSRARNLWLAALRRWHEVEEPKPEKTETGEGQRNIFLLERILDGLSRLEIDSGNLDKAVEYLNQLKPVSPFPDAIQRRIDEIQKNPSSARGSPGEQK
jgi:tetratricopeptide (TPR) repeat protein